MTIRSTRCCCADAPPLLPGLRRRPRLAWPWRRCSTTAGSPPAPPAGQPAGPEPPHFPPKAKSVIYLFMAGGPSQLELFDYKPKLQELHGKPIPERSSRASASPSWTPSPRSVPKLLGTAAQVRPARQGRHLGLGVPAAHRRRSSTTSPSSARWRPNVFNHAPAKMFMNTGSPQFGRPSMGAWVDLRHRQRVAGPARLRRAAVRPARAARRRRSLGQRLPADDLPGRAVPHRRRADPEPDQPAGRRPPTGSGTCSTPSRDLNAVRLADTGDPEIATRIAVLRDGLPHADQRPGADRPRQGRRRRRWTCTAPSRASRRSPTTACWPAAWSSAACASCSSTTPTGTITATGAENLDDRPRPRLPRGRSAGCAALVKDLKQRGLLDDTLVIWGGEFGRTPMGEVRDTVGRNHHIDAYTMWLAGGGVKPGVNLGATDELGFAAVEDRVHVHDLQATILHLLGLDHTQADLPLPGPRLPPDRRARRGGQEAAGVTALSSALSTLKRRVAQTFLSVPAQTEMSVPPDKEL